jgi:hypothetical protein
MKTRDAFFSASVLSTENVVQNVSNVQALSFDLASRRSGQALRSNRSTCHHGGSILGHDLLELVAGYRLEAAIRGILK